MIVRVYSKKSGKEISLIVHVGNVMECELASQILITTYSGVTFRFNTDYFEIVAEQS